MELVPTGRIELPTDTTYEAAALPLSYAGIENLDLRHERKTTVLLGAPIGTASNKLRKHLMFSLARRLNEHFCFRCGVAIESANEFSIEHKEPWRSAANPIASFFDLQNIAFSHLSCNVTAANQGRRIHVTPQDGYKARDVRRKGNAAWVRRREKRNLKRRLARKAAVEESKPHELGTNIPPIDCQRKESRCQSPAKMAYPPKRQL